MGSHGKKGREWWQRLPPTAREKLRRKQLAEKARRNSPVVKDFGHHFRSDLACPACGTDSTAGCIADQATEASHGR